MATFVEKDGGKSKGKLLLAQPETTIWMED
ncbi:hypothetical protein ADUPG1_010323, partial [Aduncisulcus paluster]